MNRRLRVLGAVVLALAVVVGSGAFTAVSAERGVTVEVVGDADSVLGLAPHEGPNGRYAQLDDDGLLVVDVSSTNPNDGVWGVGKRTTTRFDGVFDVTNHGTQPVRIWVDHGSPAVEFSTTTDGHGSVDGEANAIWLPPGATAAVGLVVDSHGAAVGDVLLDRVRINAAAEDADAPDPDPDTDPTPDLPDPDPIPDPGPDPNPVPGGVPSIIVGAPGSRPAGAAYVLTTPVEGEVSLSSANATFTGETSGDEAGTSVAVAGDVNGDGETDYLVGAPLNDAGGTDAGAAYVVYGPVSGTLDLADADVTLVGAVAGDEVGRSVAGAGDVNRDGFDDVLVGAPAKSFRTGGAFLVYGSASLSGTVSLANADAKFLGEDFGDEAGHAVAGADVNGDGFDDVLIGAPGHGFDGAVYLVYGGSGPDSPAGSLDLETADFKLEGDPSVLAGLATLGTSVASADVNGDGVDDILAGASRSFSPGAVYVVYGSRGVTAPVGIRSLTGADVALEGAGADDEAGTSVAGTGDVNGDGFDDILVGAPANSTAGDDAGAVFLVYGSGALPATINLTAADLVITGEGEDDEAGTSVAGVGDIDGDGFDDFVFGAPGPFGSGEGAVYLFHGGPLTPRPPTGTISAAADAILLEEPGDEAGTSVDGGT